MYKLWCLIAFLICSNNLFAETVDQISALKLEKEAAELRANIEKANAEAQESRNTYTKSLMGPETSEERKSRAEAEKAELDAKLPTVEAKPLLGTLGSEGINVLAFPPILDQLNIHAKQTCDSLPSNIFLYDKAVIDGIVGARVLIEQLKAMTASHKAVSGSPQPGGAARVTPALALGAVTTIVRASADLAALFKTNITTGKIDIGEAKALYVAMLAQNCPNKILYIPGSYLGELDQKNYSTISTTAKDLILSRHETASFVSSKKDELVSAQSAETALAAQVQRTTKNKAQLSSLLQARKNANAKLVQDIAYLEELVRNTDVLLLGLKLTDPAGSAPLLGAARFLGLADLSQDASVSVLDIEIKAEAITIIKDSIFTGQTLRITGAALVSYKLFDRTGKVLSAKVNTIAAETRQVPLR